MEIFWKTNFLALESFCKSRKSFKWLVEQDGIIPTRRVIRCQGNFEKRGLRHIGKAKDLKSKFEGGSSVQISILFYFRDGLVAKDMPSGRNFMSIGSSGGKNWSLHRHLKPKKMTKKVKKVKIFEKSVFSLKSFLKSHESFKWLVEQDGIIPTRRVIRC